MISQEKYQAAKKLLAEDRMSFRQIADCVGINRSTVANIAAEILLGKPERKFDQAKERWATDEYERCPTCGNRVLMPCLLCEINKAAIQSCSLPENAFAIGLDLQPEHSKRLQEVIQNQVARGLRSPQTKDNK